MRRKGVWPAAQVGSKKHSFSSRMPAMGLVLCESTDQTDEGPTQLDLAVSRETTITFITGVNEVF